MSEQIKIIGNQSVVWGSDGCYTSGVIVENASVKAAADQTPITDNAGNTKAVVFFNERNECTITILASASATNPAIGDTITIGGVPNCIVSDVTENWTKGAAKSITITATQYKYLSLSQ